MVEYYKDIWNKIFYTALLICHDKKPSTIRNCHQVGIHKTPIGKLKTK